MALVNLHTDLKSLKFGKDKPGMGSSNQPYIQTPIPEGEIPPSSNDFLLRDGRFAPIAIGKDVSRISQMFFDLKSPNGLLFILKQELLSRISVKTEATKGAPYGWGAFNQGIYTPTSTITQVAVEDFGTHLNLLGLDPTSPMAGVLEGGLFPSLGLNTYEAAIKRNSFPSIGFIPTQNRLTKLADDKISKADNDPNIMSYKGGPGSTIGIGSTEIRFADQRTGINNNPSLGDFSKYQVGYKNRGWKGQPLPEFYSPIDNTGTFGENVGVSFVYNDFLDTPNMFSGLNNGANGNFSRRFKTSVYKTFPFNTERIKDNHTLTWDQKQLSVQDRLNAQTLIPSLQDFREPLLKKEKKTSTIMSLAPSYKSETSPKTIDGTSTSRINYVSPGQMGKVEDYTKSKIVNREEITVDKINALPIYHSSTGAKTTKDYKDLVQFRIAAINNVDPKIKDYIHFRAYIDSFSDNYSGNWDSINYMGRGESFYKYGNFKRSISLSFTVAAQSKKELIPMYRKLNFLASNLAPSYSEEGYMAGSLVTLTLGGWCYELPGFITGMALNVPNDSTWEIGIDNKGNKDNTVRELPHIIQVTGFAFTPIEKFRPAKQKLDFTDGVTKYGDEKYIALEDEGGNIY